MCNKIDKFCSVVLDCGSLHTLVSFFFFFFFFRFVLQFINNLEGINSSRSVHASVNEINLHVTFEF